jgi:hypothetical protein
MSPYLFSEPDSPLSPLGSEFALLRSSEPSHNAGHNHQVSSPTMSSNSSNNFHASRYMQSSYHSQSELQQQLTRTQTELGATMFELERVKKQLDHVTKENMCLARERDTYR